MKHYIGPSQYSTYNRTSYAHELNIGNPAGTIIGAINAGNRYNEQTQKEEAAKRAQAQQVVHQEALNAPQGPTGYLNNPQSPVANLGGPATPAANLNAPQGAVGNISGPLNRGYLPPVSSAPTFQQSAADNDPWDGQTMRMSGSIDQSKVIGSPWYGMDMNGWNPTSGGWNPMGGF